MTCAVTALTDSDYERAQGLAQEANEFALSFGMVRYSGEGRVVHLPISMVPCVSEASFVQEVQELTPLYNRLYYRVSTDLEFLEERLAAARRVDPFIANLFDCLAPTPIEKPLLYMNRNDCMPLREGDRLQPKQVEMNLIASALGVVASNVYRMHRYLYHGTPLQQHLVENDAADGLLDGLAAGHQVFGDSRAAVLFVVPPGEVNVFDQRGLECRLVLEKDVPVSRATLAELGSEGKLREGDLWFGDRKIAVAYFRAGYSPVHYDEAACWQARRLIENSSAISVPSVATQLANTKKIQQVLTDPADLHRFVTGEGAARLQRSFVRFARISDEIEWKGTRGRAGQVAARHSGDWVLKPHREGGGNNFFGDGLVRKLGEIGDEHEAFILMERIHQRPFRSVRLIDNRVHDGLCVTELGYFGVYLHVPGEDQPRLNYARGYLQRTKDVANDEGLVLGGFSFLDAVAV
ncbi:MAG: hypothetical protein HY319_17205 [Armatimonadetes bacterium]|nr:hypothetical protein [Armatimonadota bacterium]